MSRVFTGSAGNYLSPADNAAYAVTSPAITIAAWVKRSATGSYQHFLGQSAYYFRFSSADLLDAEGTNSKISSSGTSDTSAWHHIAFTSDGSGSWVWYLDGVPVGSGSGFFWGGQNNTMRVGDVAATPFSGKMAYVAIWNTALSSGNITSLQTSTSPETIGSGCVASWHMNTSALTDSSSTANDLAVTGTVAFDTDNPVLSVVPSSGLVVVRSVPGGTGGTMTLTRTNP